ncbi:MAG: hypothetical protein Q7S00_02870, partial [bacterium]|nr:hypothetical protein [bacterium]
MQNKKRTAVVLFITLFLTGIGCGGSTTRTASGLGDSTTLTGTLVAANGTDPISGATVYVPATGSSTLQTAIVQSTKKVEVDCGASKGGTITCEAAPESTCGDIVTCSCSDGSFSLSFTGVTTSSCGTTLKGQKGAFTAELDLTCAEEPCTVSDFKVSTSSTSSANIAVVTGTFDEIENTLAKLGYGTVTSGGLLEIGTETFT